MVELLLGSFLVSEPHHVVTHQFDDAADLLLALQAVSIQLPLSPPFQTGFANTSVTERHSKKKDHPDEDFLVHSGTWEDG
jgi:hypothetical protein